MPLPGGDADKAGNRYELRWTIRQFIRVLTGDATSIHLEPIGAEGDLIEFRLKRGDGGTEVHQVKRQQSGTGHWTIADLDRVRVLDGVKRHSIEADADFIFVSTQAPKSLPELRERALSIPDLLTFEGSLSIELRGDFDQFRTRLGLNNNEQAWTAIQRSRWVAQDEQELKDTTSALLSAHLSGDPQAAVAVLAMFALESVHRQVTAQDLWNVLAKHQILPSDVAHDKNLFARLQQCRDDYLQSQAFSIGDLVLPRSEADTVAASLLESSGTT